MTNEKPENELLKAEEERIAKNAFIEYNHIHILDLKKDYAEYYLDIVPESRNYIGTVHGGIYFAMADCCAGSTARTDGRKYVTQNAQVNYIRAAKAGRIFARSSVVHRGRSGCLMDINIFDEGNSLLFSARFYFYCLSND